MSREIVRLQDVSASYDDLPVLLNIDLAVAEADFIGIVGPSGSGKSTLLRVITGALRPDAGTVWRSGAAVGYVPQVETVNWYFPVTVREVLLMASPVRRRTPFATPDELHDAERILEQLGLGGLGDRHIRALSGGQQQRVFIARALMRKPSLLLLDEPTSGVDVRTRHDVLHLLHELHHDGLTIVLTTHDLNGIASHLPTLVALNRHIVATGTPAQVLRTDVLEHAYGAGMEVLLHGGMPVVIDRYEEAPAKVTPMRGGHHGHAP